MKPVPPYASTADWPRLVSNAIGDLASRIGTGGGGSSLELDGGDSAGPGAPSFEIDGGGA